jgi:hypothetical protein
MEVFGHKKSPGACATGLSERQGRFAVMICDRSVGSRQ